MIVEQYKEIKCDFCRKTLAVKKKLFYDKKRTYVTMRADFYNRRSKIHLCGKCVLAFRDEVGKALAEV